MHPFLSRRLALLRACTRVTANSRILPDTGDKNRDRVEIYLTRFLRHCYIERDNIIFSNIPAAQRDEENTSVKQRSSSPL